MLQAINEVALGSILLLGSRPFQKICPEGLWVIQVIWGPMQSLRNIHVGPPVVAQWKSIQLVTMRLWV